MLWGNVCKGMNWLRLARCPMILGKVAKGALSGGGFLPLRFNSSSTKDAAVRWTYGASHYKTVVVQHTAVASEEQHDGPLQSVGGGESSVSEHGVVGVLADPREEPRNASQQRIVLTLQPPDSDPDSALDDLYYPGRPHCKNQ